MTAARRATQIGVITLVLMTLESCGSGPVARSSSPGSSSSQQVSSTSPPPPSTLGTSTSLTNTSYDTLKGYSLELFAAIPPDDDVVVWNATQKVIHDCMQQKGLEYQAEPYPSGGNVGFLDDPYPPQDLLEAHGYIWAAASNPTPSTAPGSGGNPDQDQVLGDCYARANDALSRQDLSAKQQVFFDADSEIAGRIASLPAVIAATEQWTSCMKSAGFVAATPADAERLAQSTGSLESPSAIAIAVQDFGCQRTAKLGELRITAKHQLVRAWLDAHPSAVSELRAATTAIVQRALSILK